MVLINDQDTIKYKNKEYDVILLEYFLRYLCEIELFE